MKVGKLVDFSLTKWFSDGKAKKYFIVAVLVSIVLSVAMNYILFDAISAMVDEVSLPIIEGLTASVGTGPVNYSSQLSQVLATVVLKGILVYGGIILLLSLASGLISGFISALAMARALELKKLSPPSFGIGKYIRLIILGLVAFIVAAFSLFNLKFLLVLILGIVLIAVGSAGTALFGPALIVLPMIGFLLIMVYLLVIIYNGLRLSLSSPAFLEKERSIGKALKLSWKTTQGNVLNIFVAVLVLSVIFFIVSFLVGLIPSTYSSSWQAQADLEFQERIGGLSVDSNVPLEEVQERTAELSEITGDYMKQSVSYTVDPLYNILSIPSQIIAGWYLIVWSFYITAIYESLLKRR